MICAGCDECYACRLRAKGMRVSSTATPNRTANRPKVLTRHTPNASWEAGRAGERRPDGSFMPLLDASRAPMGVKEHSERRSEITEQVHRLKSDPNVFRKERLTS